MRYSRRAPVPTLMAIVGATAAYIVVSACGAPPQPHGPPPVSVTSAHITRGDIATYVSFDDQITPVYKTTLSTAQAGTINAVNVTEGDFDHKGERLASLDISPTPGATRRERSDGARRRRATNPQQRCGTRCGAAVHVGDRTRGAESASDQ